MLVQTLLFEKVHSAPAPPTGGTAGDDLLFWLLLFDLLLLLLLPLFPLAGFDASPAPEVDDEVVTAAAASFSTTCWRAASACCFVALAVALGGKLLMSASLSVPYTTVLLSLLLFFA